MSEDLDPYIDPEELKKANARHDSQMKAMGIPLSGHVRSGWNIGMMILRGRLSDKKIDKYAEAGLYSAEYKAARKTLMDKRVLAKKQARNSNFVERDGRMIYVPQ